MEKALFFVVMVKMIHLAIVPNTVYVLMKQFVSAVVDIEVVDKRNWWCVNKYGSLWSYKDIARPLILLPTYL